MTTGRINQVATVRITTCVATGFADRDLFVLMLLVTQEQFH